MKAEEVMEIIQNLDSEERWKLLELMYVVPSQESLEDNKYAGAGFGLLLQEFKKTLGDVQELKKEINNLNSDNEFFTKKLATMEMKVNRLEKEQEKKEIEEV
ncbi:hypothetical protein ACFX4N_23475 [Priestia sp. YIM B13551]|uniref:hypothetical protein n=1 Tax=Priestia sp. YIM B13551 TaxID=3366306 RepID=UPI00366D1E01